MSFKTWVWWFSFAVKTKLTAHLDSAACVDRAPVQSLELYSAMFSVIACISIYVAISLLSLWSNSAPSLVSTSFQHVQKWLAWAADSHVLPAELVTGITTCGWWSLSTLLSPTALQWIFPHLLQFKLRKAWFNCTVNFTIVFFFLVNQPPSGFVNIQGLSTSSVQSEVLAWGYQQL